MYSVVNAIILIFENMNINLFYLCNTLVGVDKYNFNAWFQDYVIATVNHTNKSQSDFGNLNNSNILLIEIIFYNTRAHICNRNSLNFFKINNMEHYYPLGALGTGQSVMNIYFYPNIILARKFLEKG